MQESVTIFAAPRTSLATVHVEDERTEAAWHSRTEANRFVSELSGGDRATTARSATTLE